MGKRRGKARKRSQLQTTRTFGPDDGGGRSGSSSSSRSRSSSSNDDNLQKSVLFYNNKNNDKEEDTVKYGERQCIILFTEDTLEIPLTRIHVFGIDIRGGGKSKMKSYVHKVVSFPELNHSYRMGRGFGVLDSTIYRLGGCDLRLFEGETDYHPTDVWCCNFSYGGIINDVLLREDDIDLRCHGWKRGISTLAPKPNPLVVTARGKLYALAGWGGWGTMESAWKSEYRTGPKFEMFDPCEKIWIALPDPPFPFGENIFYDTGPCYIGHSVIGDLIFMNVRMPDELDSILYSFDMVRQVWRSYTDEYENSIVDNLRACACDWQQKALIYKNKIFGLYVQDLDPNIRAPGVYAHDLYGKISVECDPDSDFCDWELYSYPIKVCGSEFAVIKECSGEAHGYITHLGENKFCLFSVYDSILNFFKSYIHAGTFSLVDSDNHEEQLRAEDVNLIEEDIPTLSLGVKYVRTGFYNWCHIPNPRFSTRSMTFLDK